MMQQASIFALFKEGRLKSKLGSDICSLRIVRGCIQKFPDWPPGARTANGTALCHQVQLYRYFVSQYCEFCRHSTLYCFSTSVYYCCCYRLFRYQLSPETFGYTLVRTELLINTIETKNFVKLLGKYSSLYRILNHSIMKWSAIKLELLSHLS
jgi:hypothetical protein